MTGPRPAPAGAPPSPLGASGRNPFGAHLLERAAERRADDGWLARALAHPGSRAILVSEARVVVCAGTVLVDVAAARAGAAPDDVAAPVLLAEDGDGAAVFALDAGDAPEAGRAALPPGGELHDIKPLAMLLPEREASLLAFARAMTHWHRTHRFCGGCGAATRAAQGGHLRVCERPECARQHFPRTDPAVIMLVTRGERALLARHPAWPPTSFATLAGFVEPGESLEAAVAREVYEEAGVRLERIAYHSSQPWPFPGSLMIGFTAEACSDGLRLDPAEVAEARWLTRAELRRQVEAGALSLPSPVSIAYRLVSDWLEG